LVRNKYINQISEGKYLYVEIVKGKKRPIMSDKIHDPINTFFYGDPVGDDMYSTSVGDTWLYFYENKLASIVKITSSTTEPDKAYTLDDLPNGVKDVLKNEIPLIDTTYMPVNELAKQALRMVSAEISELISSRMIGENSGNSTSE